MSFGRYSSNHCSINDPGWGLVKKDKKKDLRIVLFVKSQDGTIIKKERYLNQKVAQENPMCLESSNKINLLKEPIADIIARASFLQNDSDHQSSLQVGIRNNFKGSTLNRGVKRVQNFADYYAPKKFIELVGNGQINRNLLKWLKLWDGAVFGKVSSVLSSRKLMSLLLR